MPHMKLIGKLGWLVSIILSFGMGLSDLNYTWLLPITTFQILSYYLLHFKNFKFKKIGKRNNPFIKELPRHLIIQSFITLIFLNSFSISGFFSVTSFICDLLSKINIKSPSETLSPTFIFKDSI